VARSSFGVGPLLAVGNVRPVGTDSVQVAGLRWDGYAGLVYFHLLLDRLAEAGYLDGIGSDGTDVSDRKERADAEA